MDSKTIKLHIFLLSLTLNSIAGHYYNPYYFYKILAFNEVEKSQLYQMYKEEQDIIFLNDVTNGPDLPTKVVVKKDKVNKFESFLQKTSIQYQYVGNITKSPPSSSGAGVEIDESFYNWLDILSWIDSNINKYPALLTKKVIAKTDEDRDVVLLQISYTNKNNPIVFIVGGENGMDWISSSIILSFVQTLLLKKEDIMKLLMSFNFYIVPILNPDGFVYSKETCWLWKKNRSTIKTNCYNGPMFKGVNIAKNWFFKEDIKGLKKIYPLHMGCTPVSENETKGLANALNNVSLNMIAFINLYGYGNCITIPYAYSNYQSNNYHIVKEILEAARNKFKIQFNTQILIGQTNSLFYNRFGTVADWVKMKLNTPIVYTIHMEDERYFLQLPESINRLKEQFITILNESLPISKLFYGHLFNNALKLKGTMFFVIQLSLYNCIITQLFMNKH